MAKTILITRPKNQSQALIDGIETLGYSCLELPCLTIKAHALSLGINELALYTALVFTSANAVTRGIPYQSITQPVLAIGPGTSDALGGKGVPNVITATPYNSDGLLALPILKNIANKKIAIFTGENPKALLAETLQQRGATVNTHYCYKRLVPQYTEADIMPITQTVLAAIIVTSEETLNALATIFEKHRPWLLDQNIITGTLALKKAAKTIGFQSVTVAKSPYTADLIELLRKQPL